MSLHDDLKDEISNIFSENWSTREGRVVPDTDDIQLGNHAVKLEGTVLYADICESTSLVDGYKSRFAAKVYKAFLYGAAKVIRDEDGVITAYDGDRVMAVYIGDSKNTSAARTARKINYLVTKIINPAIEERYPSSDFKLKHVVGVDTSDLFIARTGIRGSNDLVWIGRAANYAAKLTEHAPRSPSKITIDVYNRLHKSEKYHEGDSMWDKCIWDEMGDFTIYTSTWRRKI